MTTGLRAASAAIPAAEVSSNTPADGFAVGEQEPSGTAQSLLTPREYQVVRLRAIGWTRDQITHELRISKNTVMDHMHNAYDKYGATCLVELLAELGWLNVPAEA